ncbi:hypothetical protein IB211_00431 [Intestinimonas butyriciproducens]|uniref:Uncharacterized protein n=1 Tax=Intestinimonas butyriciproducens TaxID=1297617 RepID=A0A0S2W0I2_9FIRM|nr:hypothetical protein IB211_00431 [Intestinimonas butyriciproducens]
MGQTSPPHTKHIFLRDKKRKQRQHCARTVDSVRAQCCF